MHELEVLRPTHLAFIKHLQSCEGPRTHDDWVFPIVVVVAVDDQDCGCGELLADTTCDVGCLTWIRGSLNYDFNLPALWAILDHVDVYMSNVWHQPERTGQR